MSSLRIALPIVLALLSEAALAAPLIQPQPKRVLVGEYFTPPAAYRLELRGSGLGQADPGVARLRQALAARGCLEQRSADFVIRLGLLEKSAEARRRLRRVESTDALPAMREAHFIHLERDGAMLGGHSPRALYYALLSLSQWIESSTAMLQAGFVLDWPSLPLRMLMLDPARLVERKPYYEKVLRFLSEEKYNVLMLHLSDDPTVALRFDRHPDAADPNAWTPEEMRRFIALAAAHHVDVLPEIELFGHARGWTQHPRYADLAEPRTASFTPHNPRTYELIDDLVVETARLFPWPLLHAGLDEVAGPTSDEGRAFVAEHGRVRWLTDHIRKVHASVTGQGKLMAMWGDMLLNHPQAAYAIPRDTIIFDWHYESNFDDRRVRWRTAMPPQSWAFFRDLGFPVVAAPALMSGHHRLWPDADSLLNTTKMSRMAAEYGLLGVAVTVWLPSRYLPDSVWYGYAMAGGAMWAGRGFDEPAAQRQFLSRYFGLEVDDADARMWNFLLDRTPTAEDFGWILARDAEGHNVYARRGGRRLGGRLAEAEQALRHWSARAPQVARHEREFADVLRVARIIETVAWRQAHDADFARPEVRAEARRRYQAVLSEIDASFAEHRYPVGVAAGQDDPYVRHHDLRRYFVLAIETTE